MMGRVHVYGLITVTLFIISTYILHYYHLPRDLTDASPEPIYCVMITGKNDSRQYFAELAIKNFKLQSYPNKKLVIINESEPLNVHDDNIFEKVITSKQRESLTLGDMRNMAFEYIPEDAIWTTWDDDDWRSNDYLQYLFDELKHFDYVFFTKRVEHNINTSFTWIMELKSGFVIMFGRKREFAKYDSKEYNEDIMLKKTISKHLKSNVIDNDPMIYIRFTHKDNTSTLVKRNKIDVKDTSSNKVYFESPANEMQTAYVEAIVNKHLRHT